MNNSKNNDMIDIKEISFVMFKNIWLIVLLGVVGYVGMYIYGKSTEVPTYTSSVSLYVKNTTNKTSLDSVSASDLVAAKTIAETYIPILENDDHIVESIGAKLLAKYTPEELSNYFTIIYDENGVPSIDEPSIRNKISFEQVNGTELLNVSVTTPNPVMSADVCTYVTEVAPDELIRIVGAGAVQTVGMVKIPKFSDGSSVPSMARTGLLAGIILALVIIYLRYILDNTVSNGEVIKAKYDLPMLAEIPYYDVEGKGNHKSKKPNIITKIKNKFGKNTEIERNIRSTIKDVEVPFVVTEAYNTFRTNMLFSFSANKSNIAIVSSAFAGEGKSTSTANLAISIGETEAKILLIDADLRRPTQHKLFKLSNDKGLSTLLSGMSNLENTVNKRVLGNLDVITSGPMPPNPSQMLTSENMQNLLNDISAKYDYILIDTSPVNIVSDALILSKLTAGIVLVTRHNITTYDQVDRAIDSIELINGNVLGIVINSVDMEGGLYGKNGYKYKYRYKYNYKYTYSYDDKDKKDA